MSEKSNQESERTTVKKEKRGMFTRISNGFKRITNSLKGIFTSNTDTKMITEGKKDPIAQKADQEIKEIYDRQQAEKEKYGLTDEEYSRKISTTYSNNMRGIYNNHFKMTDEDVERLFDLSDGRETLRGKDERYENLKEDYNNLSEEERKLNDRGKEM